MTPIRTRPLTAPVAVLGAVLALAVGAATGGEGKDEGFVPLFNGRDLAGWVGDTTGYVVRAGTLVCLPKGGKLFTEKTYSDFHLRFEFRLPPGGNNGLGIRTTTLEGQPAFTAIELQILDNHAPRHADLKPYQYHGSVYGVVPAKRGHLKKPGKWNRQEVIAKGGRIRVILNGHTILDADVWKIDPEKTMDGRPHPGLHHREGRLGFIGHGDRVAFRNIRIKELVD